MAPPKKTHCIRGHEFTPANTYWAPDGSQRQCRACWNSRYKVSPRAPIPTMPTDIATLAYAAGILDGEGHVQIRTLKRKNDKRYHAVTVRITSTDEDLAHWLRATFGGSITNVGTNHATHKAAFQWAMLSRHANVFLRALRPYLRIKAKQADVALALQETMLSPGQKLPAATLAYREGLLVEMHRLNARGVPVDEADAA